MMLGPELVQHILHAVTYLYNHVAVIVLGVIDDVHSHGLCTDEVSNAEGAELPLVYVEVTDSPVVWLLLAATT